MTPMSLTSRMSSVSRMGRRILMSPMSPMSRPCEPYATYAPHKPHELRDPYELLILMGPMNFVSPMNTMLPSDL